MIGRMDIQLERLPPAGDRNDYSVRVFGPGDTDYSFPLSITRTALTVWSRHGSDVTDESIRGRLAQTIVELHGTATPFPERGYWLDSYNAETTLEQTCNKMRAVGITAFQRDKTVSDDVRNALGEDVLAVVDRANEHALEHHGQELLRSLDLAFEPSEAQEDLGTDPRDKPGFVYRVCILSVIIDRFGLGRPDHGPSSGSLQDLRSWLEGRVDAATVEAITQPLRMVKYLRKQYPIHEHYEETAEGQRQVRRELRQAREFFGFRERDHARNWNRVKRAFIRALELLGSV